MNTPASTPATYFKLMVRNFPNSVFDLNDFHDRGINEVWENKHLPLFKIVPPVAGAVINIECSFTIIKVEYAGGKIVLWVSKV